MAAEEPNYDLDAPAINSYSNIILWDMRNYRNWYDRRFDKEASLTRTLLALKRLLKDMPPKGKSFMQQKISAIVNLEEIMKIDSYEQAEAIYDIAIEWLWENILEMQFGHAKPRYGKGKI